MSFYWDAFQDFTLMEKVRRPDGEGGYNTVWKDGTTVKVSLNRGSASEIRRAQAEDLKTVFTVSMPINSPIQQFDCIKAQNGEVFKITANPEDNKTPPEASYQAKYATAERTTLPE